MESEIAKEQFMLVSVLKLAQCCGRGFVIALNMFIVAVAVQCWCYAAWHGRLGGVAPGGM